MDGSSFTPLPIFPIVYLNRNTKTSQSDHSVVLSTVAAVWSCVIMTYNNGIKLKLE